MNPYMEDKMKTNMNRNLMIKDINNIEVLMNSGYGYACMNEQTLAMHNLNQNKVKKRISVLSLLIALFK